YTHVRHAMLAIRSAPGGNGRLSSAVPSVASARGAATPSAGRGSSAATTTALGRGAGSAPGGAAFPHAVTSATTATRAKTLRPSMRGARLNTVGLALGGR